MDEQEIVRASVLMVTRSFIRQKLRESSKEGHDVLLQLALDSNSRVTALFRPGIIPEQVLLVVDSAEEAVEMQQQLPQAEDRWELVGELLEPEELEQLEEAVVLTLRPVQLAVREELLDVEDMNQPALRPETLRRMLKITTRIPHEIISTLLRAQGGGMAPDIGPIGVPEAFLPLGPLSVGDVNNAATFAETVKRALEGSAVEQEGGAHLFGLHEFGFISGMAGVPGDGSGQAGAAGTRQPVKRRRRRRREQSVPHPADEQDGFSVNGEVGGDRRVAGGSDGKGCAIRLDRDRTAEAELAVAVLRFSEETIAASSEDAERDA